MIKRFLFCAGCIAIAFCAGIIFGNRDTQRITADSYSERSIPVPYGNPVEQVDHSTQAGALQDALNNAGEKVSDAMTDASELVSAGNDAAEKVLDATEDVSDTVSAGSDLVQSLLKKASDATSRIQFP